jgi:antitoxin (DNA-binding transcriptional repressor) of toxin-antitoxin stability system
MIFAGVAPSATLVHMARSVSIRELRNATSSVVSELEAGERLTLTVNRRPIADILPHVTARDPWVPASELRRILGDAAADPGLLEDLADVRGDELEDD